MKLIAPTNTWYGRGCPIVGHEALERVRRAYRSIGGAVRFYSDEDAYFVSADCQEGDTPSYADQEENEGDYPGLDWVSDDIANNEAEAIRLWWNLYGYCASEDEDEPVIYCNGDGPDGIGGFYHPEHD